MPIAVQDRQACWLTGLTGAGVGEGAAQWQAQPFCPQVQALSPHTQRGEMVVASMKPPQRAPSAAVGASLFG